jgi:hypothetical protein
MSHVSQNLAALYGGGIGLTDPLLYHVTITQDPMSLVPGDGVILCRCLQPLTISLPPARQCQGRAFIVMKIDQSANPVTVASQDAQDTINGARTVQILGWPESKTLLSDGLNWWVLEYNGLRDYLPVIMAFGVPKGGNTHDVLQKKSNANYDTDWATPYWQPIGPAPPLARAATPTTVLTALVSSTDARATPIGEGYSIALVNPATPAAGQAIYFGDPTTGAQTTIAGTPTEIDLTVQGGKTTQLLPWGVHAPDLRVDAAQLRRQAVKTTLPASLNIAASPSATWTTVVTLPALTVAANANVTLRGGAGLACFVPKASSARYGARFLCDGVEVERYSIDLAAPNQDNITVPFPELVAESQPAAGAHTYAFQVLCTGTGATVTSNSDTPRPVVRATEYS